LLHRHPTGESALWRAVLAQALHDAATGPRRRHRPPLSAERARVRDQARDWLTGGGRDFRQVCDLADLDALAVHAAAVVAIREADERTPPTAHSQCSMLTAAAA